MSSFNLDMSDIIKNIVKEQSKNMEALGVHGDRVAKEMESYAKSHIPWNDKDSDAKDKITGQSQNLGNKVRCSISHGVDYGIYLEMCNEGKYSILKPTIDAVGPKAVKGLEKIFK
ncbi:hypothetical protein LZ906_007840 [Paraclostridium ghonii]|uniref:hypothetical protein n=1 Tax=Paraclostridium ghonii TaxID=29358 RepID=UPI00202D0560|nr:hypothetical protein [Paeniclostridium ghonii]MCM0165658.1 hypothetical protein [Paeniclostridium ghonii]